jgi:hypothetical protein
VVGESTAQTVTIKSIGVMPDILWLVPEQVMQKAIVTVGEKFHYTVKGRKRDVSPPALKIDTKYQPSLVTFEIDQIKAGG